MVYDNRPYLSGQGTYGPLRVPGLRGPMHFWERHHAMPPAQNTVIVYSDGTVLEGHLFGPEVFDDPDVHRIFVGGYKHNVTLADDPLSYNALIGAGYTMFVPSEDRYPVNDEYPVDDIYPEAGTP